VAVSRQKEKIEGQFGKRTVTESGVTWVFCRFCLKSGGKSTERNRKGNYEEGEKTGEGEKRQIPRQGGAQRVKKFPKKKRVKNIGGTRLKGFSTPFDLY